MNRALRIDSMSMDFPLIVIVSNETNHAEQLKSSLPGVALRCITTIDEACVFLADTTCGLVIVAANGLDRSTLEISLRKLQAVDPSVTMALLDSTRNPQIMQSAFDLGIAFYQEDKLIASVVEAAEILSRNEPKTSAHDAASGSAADLLFRGFFSLAFQPVWDLTNHSRIGYEALFRGPQGTDLGNPEAVFHSRSTLNKDTLGQLDLTSLGAALRIGSDLPDGEILFVNARDETFTRNHGNVVALQLLIERYARPDRRIVIEIAEDADLNQLDRLAAALIPLRGMGVGIALDDVAASNSWLHMVLRLEPEYIKFDRGLVTGIHHDRKKGVLLHSLSELANRMGADVIVEGIETEDELATVKELGVRYAQGYLLGRPAAADHWQKGKIS